MGIPSFYRHLCRRHPRLIGVGVGRAPEWLCLDFNCAMYYVLRKMRPVAEAASRDAWEGEFADAIASYMRRLVELAAPTRGVYVSCDGVVCAAKRRQQRMRRFRGPWFAEAERAARGVEAGAGETDENYEIGWDQNALTPGTAFMERLGGVLEAMGRRLAVDHGGALDVRVSTTAEPGEGEHKLLAAMRGLPVPPRTVTIYGLDADLILLAALLGADTGAEVLLMREAQEFERGGPGDEWRHLNVRGLVEAVVGGGSGSEGRVRDWVAAMTLLGNDFLPRSLTRTVRDGGIPALLGALREQVWSEGRQLVGADGRLSRSALLALLRVWAATEEADMTGAVREAVRAAGAARRSTGALEEWQSSPARWCSLGRLGVGAPMGSGTGALKPSWRRIYREVWRAGPVGDYLAGLAWVWDYYSGRPVCQGWCYDHHLPPLWGDLVAELEGVAGGVVEPPPVRWSESLPAWTHLLSVLPAESVVTLLPAERGARFVAAEPWWWPASWSLFDVGRGQMWECEAVLPLVPESTLRRWSGGAGGALV